MMHLASSVWPGAVAGLSLAEWYVLAFVSLYRTHDLVSSHRVIHDHREALSWTSWWYLSNAVKLIGGLSCVGLEVVAKVTKLSIIKDGILLYPTGTIPVWGGYGNTFIPMSSTHTLPAKSWGGHGYIPAPMGIPILYPFILTYES